MKDVIFYEAFEEEAAAIKKNMPSDISADYTWKTIQEAGDTSPPARVISIRTQSAIPLDWSEGIVLLTRSTGYDHISAYRRAVRHDVPAGYLPLYCNRAVAEQAALMWLTLMRKLILQRHNFATFHRDGITGTETAGKNLTVFGVGNIGYEVIRIGRGLDMNSIGVDITERHEDVTYVSPEEGLKRADVCVCAMNLTTENDGYFSLEKLQKLPSHALFINIARGELSPPELLLERMEKAQLGGVGLDVYPHEKELAVALRGGGEIDIESTHPDIRALMQMTQRADVICTPHNAFNTREAVARKAAHACEQLQYYLDNNEFKWCVPSK